MENEFPGGSEAEVMAQMLEQLELRILPMKQTLDDIGGAMDSASLQKQVDALTAMRAAVREWYLRLPDALQHSVPLKQQYSSRTKEIDKKLTQALIVLRHSPPELAAISPDEAEKNSTADVELHKMYVFFDKAVILADEKGVPFETVLTKALPKAPFPKDALLVALERYKKERGI